MTNSVPTSPDLLFRKSSYSQPTGNCVEVADLPGGAAAMRDTQNRKNGYLAFSAAEWGALVSSVCL